MNDVVIRILHEEEYLSNLKKEIENGGLKKAIKKRCDEIFNMCSSMKYITHMSICELLCEISDLAELSDDYEKTNYL